MLIKRLAEVRYNALQLPHFIGGLFCEKGAVLSNNRDFFFVGGTKLGFLSLKRHQVGGPTLFEKRGFLLDDLAQALCNLN